MACAWLLRRQQSRLTLKWWEKLGIGLGAFIGAMLGAKLPFVLYYWDSEHSAGVWFTHGKTILAGLVGGYLGVEYAKWTLRIRVKTGDTSLCQSRLGSQLDA